MARDDGKENAKDDHTDQLREQWSIVRPDIDTSAMGVVGRINRLALLLGDQIGNLMLEHGLERGEFDVLATLRRVGEPYELSPTQLYRSLMLSSGGVTNRLKRLTAKGMIERQSDPNDGRSDLVRLTTVGLRTVDETFAADMTLEAKLINGLQKSQLIELDNLLRALCRTVEDERK